MSHHQLFDLDKHSIHLVSLFADMFEHIHHFMQLDSCVGSNSCGVGTLGPAGDGHGKDYGVVWGNMIYYFCPLSLSSLCLPSSEQRPHGCPLSTIALTASQPQNSFNRRVKRV